MTLFFDTIKIRIVTYWKTESVAGFPEICPFFPSFCLGALASERKIFHDTFCGVLLAKQIYSPMSSPSCMFLRCIPFGNPPVFLGS